MKVLESAFMPNKYSRKQFSESIQTKMVFQAKTKTCQHIMDWLIILFSSQPGSLYHRIRNFELKKDIKAQITLSLINLFIY
jgi:hypothetical protein